MKSHMHIASFVSGSLLAYHINDDISTK